jgi:hypothetical protein
MVSPTSIRFISPSGGVALLMSLLNLNHLSFFPIEGRVHKENKLSLRPSVYALLICRPIKVGFSDNNKMGVSADFATVQFSLRAMGSEVMSSSHRLPYAFHRFCSFLPNFRLFGLS